MAASISCFVAKPALARAGATKTGPRRARVLPAANPRSNVVDGESAVESGEWEAVESLGSQDDVLAWYNHQHETRNTRLHDVMQTNLVVTSPGASLAEVTALLDGPPSIEGMPVVDGDNKLVGVVSRKDLAKGGALVQDIMSSTPVSLKASGKVADAAEIMIKHKFHRVPVVDDDNTCVGIVTRSDIFWALTQTDQEGDTLLTEHGLDV